MCSASRWFLLQTRLNVLRDRNDYSVVLLEKEKKQQTARRKIERFIPQLSQGHEYQLHNKVNA